MRFFAVVVIHKKELFLQLIFGMIQLLFYLNLNPLNTEMHMRQRASRDTKYKSFSFFFASCHFFVLVTDCMSECLK